MRLAGLQKLTLLDYPGKMACTVFTYGCNFRCPYCHNAPLVLPGAPPSGMDEDELLQFLQKRRGMLEGVVITGGEPLLHEGLPALLGQIKALGYLVKLDTNGAHPTQLRRAIEAGLVDYVAMDVKNSPALYQKTTGCAHADVDAAAASKELLLRGGVNYEFRTTVVKGLHTRESLVEAAKWIAGAKAYYLQQFKNSGELIAGEGLAAFDEQHMQCLAEAVRPYVSAVQVRGI